MAHKNNNLANRSDSDKPRPATPSHHPSGSYTPAEKLTRADDLMSDVLDCFLWPTPNNSSHPPKRTIKFTPGYRRPRALNINDFKQIIHSVQTGELRNLTEATTLIRQLPAVIHYLNNSEPPRLGKHIGLYLQLFLPKCGIRFCETDRYDQRRQPPTVEQAPPESQLSSSHCSTPATQSSSNSTRQRSRIRANELRDLIGSSQISPEVAPRVSRRGSTRSREPHARSNNLTHLAVFAARDYAPNDIVAGCEGSYADLTEEEDLKLRSNAHLPAQVDRSTGAAPRESTDFSHIVNSRGKFQVFCGPARFVNHDCDNNAVLLREGFTIKFKVTKPIKAGQEILTSYGMNYFGEKNCECMCATCERNGKGFYSQHEADSDSDGNKQLTTQQQDSSIKNEFEESNQSMPSLGTDTDLSSLGDSSEGTTSRASNTPALEHSPPASYSTTPSHVRRQLAQSQSALTDPRPNSRSSSTRRQRPSQPDHQDQLKSSAAAFVSPVKFRPTQDLTLSILRPPEPERVEPQQNLITKIEPPPVSEPVKQPAGPKADGQVLPVKRKTYWITTKQKQLGLVPWEADTITPTSSTSQPYSPMTPSLLGPSRRDSMDRSVSGQKRKAPTESCSARLPKRSYWVSTKEKELGIVPWEAGAADESPEPSAAHPRSCRSTRASRRASEGMDAVIGFPTAPRGSKLSYKVFQEGTQEAEMLNTAIGRELLGFRPRAAKKKTVATEEEKGEQENAVASSDNRQLDSADTPLDLNGDASIGPYDEIASFLLRYPGEQQPTGAQSGGESGKEEAIQQEEKTVEKVEEKEDGGPLLVAQVASTTGSPSTCTSSISPKLHSRPRRAVVKERQPKPASRPRRKPHSFPAALDTPSEHSGSLSPVPTPRLIPSHRSNDNIPRDIQPKDDPASSAKSPSTNGHRLLVSSIG
ncbi:Histone-lysine N-methyltransferase set9 [Puccinia graminis f. sp. tritici]|uniref:Histone-lysine N-methyltransferase set9 n=1 Tax=Puccinia graminis f. sp. tritici TaxID=56615 RepID=A0A5B0MGN7_PUCGR|nr:Histone-lysine N-methyltransferase set9 [Puccinia graminis f. sp. tritici]KAA1135562.1 Histone-lysine N-methyltransferase set9 [Puccinia graminis f. sp. tritici]